MDRLGLRRRRHDGKGALAHRCEHERRGKDLRHRPHDDETEEAAAGPGKTLARDGEHDQEEQRREGQPVEEAHLRRPDGAERLGQPALRRVAGRLRGGGRERRRYPEQGEVHRGATTYLPLKTGLRFSMNAVRPST